MKSLSVILLLAFCMSELRPLMPYVEYYLNYEYISEVLCINKDKPMTRCNGKCYLSKMLRKANGETKRNSERTIPKVEWKQTTLKSEESEPNNWIKTLDSSIDHKSLYYLSYRSVFISIPSPPPKG